jgi:drug/metabolite transporter (DMT)-like permease
MPAGVSSLLVGTQPLLTALFGATVGERVTRLQWLGLLLGVVGIALVLSDRLTLAGVGPLALLVNLLALVGITAGTLYQKRHGADVDLRTGSIIQFGVSFLAVLPFAIVLESMTVDFTIEFWFALAWSIVALSLVAISLLLVMIRRGRATEVASLMYLTPAALPARRLIFGERLGIIACAG